MLVGGSEIRTLSTTGQAISALHGMAGGGYSRVDTGSIRAITASVAVVTMWLAFPALMLYATLQWVKLWVKERRTCDTILICPLLTSLL